MTNYQDQLNRAAGDALSSLGRELVVETWSETYSASNPDGSRSKVGEEIVHGTVTTPGSPNYSRSASGSDATYDVEVRLPAGVTITTAEAESASSRIRDGSMVYEPVDVFEEDGDVTRWYCVEVEGDE